MESSRENEPVLRPSEPDARAVSTVSSAPSSTVSVPEQLDSAFQREQPDVDTFDYDQASFQIDSFCEGLGINTMSQTLDREALRSVASDLSEVERWPSPVADVFCGAVLLASIRTPPRSNRVL